MESEIPDAARRKHQYLRGRGSTRRTSPQSQCQVILGRITNQLAHLRGWEKKKTESRKGCYVPRVYKPAWGRMSDSFLPSSSHKTITHSSRRISQNKRKRRKDTKRKERAIPFPSHKEPPRITLTFAILGIVGNSLFSGTLPRLGRNPLPPAAACRPRSSLRRRRREDPLNSPTLHQQLHPNSLNSSLSVDQLVAAKMMAFHSPCSGRTIAPARLSA